MANANDTLPPFPGFERPRQNYFKMPNNWTDVTAQMTSLAEIKVAEYVLKHTWGYQEYGIPKRISLTDFMLGRRRKDGSRMDDGTGLSKPSVIAGVKAAIERGLLIEETDDSDLGHVKKYYRLRMLETADDDDENNADGNGNDSDDSPPPRAEKDREATPVKHLNAEVKNLDRGVKNFDRGVKYLDRPSKDSLPRTKKETKETNIQERHLEGDNNTTRMDDLPNPVVVALLTDRGVSKKVAETLTKNHDEAYISEKIAYLEFLQETHPDEVQRPIGWLRTAIEEDYGEPSGYVSADERRRQGEEEEYQRQQAQTAVKQREAERKKERKQYAQNIEALRQQYGTTPSDQAAWSTVMQEIKAAGETDLETLLGDALILQTDGSTFVVGIASPSAAQQLLHPRNQTLLKKTIKRVLRQAFDVKFVPIDPT